MQCISIAVVKANSRHTKLFCTGSWSGDCPVHCSVEKSGAGMCTALQCSEVLCSAVQCSTVQYSAVQCSAVQCSYDVLSVVSPAEICA